MKVYVCTDLEGCSGVTSFEDQGFATGKYYEQAKRILTAEVNAAVEGMLAEGVEDVLILDGHGPGAMSFEDLHPAAKLLHGRPLAHRNVRNEIVKQYDVGMMIGQHAMAGADRATMNHTQSSRTIEYYKLNGKFIGEIAQWSLYVGALGLPVIFLAGDDAGCKEAAELIPGIVTTSVKQGLSRTSAISVAPAEAHRRIREGVRKAIQNHRAHPIQPLVWPGPYVLEKRFLFSDMPGYDGGGRGEWIDNKTVRLTGEHIHDVIYE